MNFRQELRNETARFIRRRWFLQQCGLGLGSIALASLLGTDAAVGAATKPATANPLSPRPSPFPPKARRVIYLFMGGAPSQLDLFDFKPTLKKVQRPACAQGRGDGAEVRLHQTRRGAVCL